MGRIKILITNKQKTIKSPVLDNIPGELKSWKQWVAWKAEFKDNGKIDKIPVNPTTGMYASSNKPESWGTYGEAVAYYKKHSSNGIAGIGFVFTKDDPFCGVDLDNCYDPETEEMEDWADEILMELLCYCEISPSNTGVKIFAKGTLPGPGRKNGNIEIYDTGRYFTVTGAILERYPSIPGNRDGEIAALYSRLCGEKQKGKPVPTEQSERSSDMDIDSLPVSVGTKKLIREGEDQGRRSEAIMSVVNALVGNGSSESEIFRIFDTCLIGEKYREKGSSKKQWLLGRIDKAKKYVEAKEEPESESEEAEEEQTLTFPYDVMTGAAGSFADVYGSVLETPKEFLYMSYLTCLGTVLSKRLTLASEIAPQPRLYTLLLGQSADERKSTSLEKTIDHFKEATDRFEVCRGVNSAEGLQKVLEKNTNGLLLSLDEFKQFVSKCRIDSSVLLPCVNTLFESNNYESRTKSAVVKLEEAHLSLLTASTVQTYERTWHSSFTDIGFNNRLFIVPGTAERKHSFPAKVSDFDRYKLKLKLEEVLKHVGGFMELEITESAKAIFHDWYMSMERSVHAKRLDTYAMRLMSLLAVNDLKNEVDEETVRKAIKLCDWELKVRKLYDPIDADTGIAKMEEKIRRQLRGKALKDAQLKQGVNANRAGLWAYKTALNNLKQAGEIDWNNKKKRWKYISQKT
jgi:Protein of unknown function (DUF3987)